MKPNLFSRQRPASAVARLGMFALIMALLASACSSTESPVAAPDTSVAEAAEQNVDESFDREEEINEAGRASDDPSVNPVEETPPDPDTEVKGSVETKGAVIYVRSNGNDNNDGSSTARAVRTTGRALQLSSATSVIDIGAGTFDPLKVSNVSGASDAPFTIRGAGAQTVLTSNSYDRDAGVFVQSSSNVRIENLRVTRSLWGVQVDNSSHVEIHGLTIDDIGQEAVRFKNQSRNVGVWDSTIDGTGNRPGAGNQPFNEFGEGVYIGSGAFGGDATHDVVVSGNEIMNATAEGVDIKQETYNIVVENNRIHDINTIHSGAISVGIGTTHYRDANITIRSNSIYGITTRSKYTDGNAIAVSASADIYNNIIWDTEHSAIVVDRNFVNKDANDVAIFNNTFDDAGLEEVRVFTGPNQADLTIVNNIGHSAPGNLELRDEFFLDSSIRNYELRSDASAALDSASDLGLRTDKLGTPRPQGGGIDMGALERPETGPVNDTTVAPAPTTPRAPAATTPPAPASTTAPTQPPTNRAPSQPAPELSRDTTTAENRLPGPAASELLLPGGNTNRSFDETSASVNSSEQALDGEGSGLSTTAQAEPLPTETPAAETPAAETPTAPAFELNLPEDPATPEASQQSPGRTVVPEDRDVETQTEADEVPATAVESTPVPDQPLAFGDPVGSKQPSAPLIAMLALFMLLIFGGTFALVARDERRS